MPEIPVVPALWRFPAHPASVPRARRAVAGALAPEVRRHLRDDLTLLTSELVTNAIRHGTRPAGDDLVELVLWPADGHYWLAVSDPASRDGARTPVVARPCVESEGGRGLVLVDHLAAVWGTRPRPVRGTSVIAGLAVRP
ncbi:ATP-binding protein [Streptomyces sp. TS71-3]|uniref:ATP-binding protein n=1 Tax=Streptomyces sp. TS71-3 TaxID=2733862 RepID=UPI001B243F70|nr:ATP-binding protein [Streptomyces sp. TS71-3]GHJ34814.1 hypothetical protein Sm713_04230 [Streptomyces sp. TS71-3]